MTKEGPIRVGPSFFFEGRNLPMLRLRPYKPSDAAKIVAWVSDWDGFSAWCADLLD